MDQATAANVESQRAVRKLVENIREVGARLDREAEARTEARTGDRIGDHTADCTSDHIWTIIVGLLAVTNELPLEQSK